MSGEQLWRLYMVFSSEKMRKLLMALKLFLFFLLLTNNKSCKGMHLGEKQFP